MPKRFAAPGIHRPAAGANLPVPASVCAPFLAPVLACVLALLVAASPFFARQAHAARGLTCDFYDIVELPEEWKVSISPGFNNADRRSLGHYYNRDRNSSVLIQIDRADFDNDIDAVAKKLVEGLERNGATILSPPVADGPLMRLEATLTGTPALIWIGTKDELSSLAIITGDRDACRDFLSHMRNADPLLLPSADMVPAPTPVQP